jgi:hypothetical protein
MTRMDTEQQKLDPRRREAHPERIVIGDEVFVRNDIKAKAQGESERSLNRGDKDGAPYRFFGGVKYRPERRYDQFVLKSIKEDGRPPAPKRKRHKPAAAAARK